MMVSLLPELLPQNAANIAEFCLEKDISFVEVENINSEYSVNELENAKPDYIISNWPKILKKNVLDIPKHMIIGTHPTPLPMNQGRHPIHWMIVLGIHFITSLSFFAMDEGIDTGRILLQLPFSVGNRDITQVNSDMNRCAYDGTKKLIKMLENDQNYIGYEQLSQFQNYWRKRNEHDITLDPRMSLEMLTRIAHSFAPPYPGARLWVKPDRFLTISKINKAKQKDYPVNWFNFEHGYIFSTSEEYLVMRIADDVAEIHVVEERDFWHDLDKKKICPPTFYLQKKYASD